MVYLTLVASIACIVMIMISSDENYSKRFMRPIRWLPVGFVVVLAGFTFLHETMQFTEISARKPTALAVGGMAFFCFGSLFVTL